MPISIRSTPNSSRQAVSLSPRKATRLQTVCAKLHDLAHHLGAGEKLPTVVQLRDQMGVSLATLNAAMGELEAQNILVRRHGVGVFVSPKLLQKNIALLCDPSFFRVPGLSPFWDMLIEIARNRAQANNEGFSLHFSTPENAEAVVLLPGAAPLGETLFADIEAGKVHGVLGIGVGREPIERIQAHRIPMVGFAGASECLYTVVLNGVGTVEHGVPALQAKGCQRLGFWSPLPPFRGPYPTDPNSPERQAFCQMLGECGLPFLPELVRESGGLVGANGKGPWTSESHQEQGFRLALDIFGPEADPALRPDGLISTDDMMTRGILTALQKLHVVVNRDVHLVTHANVGSQVLFGHEDELTLVEANPADVVQAMFGQLETLMDNQTPSEAVVTVRPQSCRVCAPYVTSGSPLLPPGSRFSLSEGTA